MKHAIKPNYWLRATTLALTLLMALPAFAQPEDVEYFTDDEVVRSNWAFQGYYSPMYSNRSLISDDLFPTQEFFFLNQSTTGAYADDYGVDIIYKPSDGFQFALGVSRSRGGYTWDFVKIVDQIQGGGDTIDITFKSTTTAEHINIPFSFIIHQRMNDDWSLEFVPAIEANYLTRLYRGIEYTGDGEISDSTETDISFGDLTDVARQWNWTVGIGIGGRYWMTDNLSFFVRGKLRYMILPLIDNNGPREVLFQYGGSFGIRYDI